MTGISTTPSIHVQPNRRSVTGALQSHGVPLPSHKTTRRHSLRELEALQWPDAGLIARDAIGGHGPRALSTLRESLSRVDGDITTNSCRLY
jgi:hypothetical protein